MNVKKILSNEENLCYLEEVLVAMLAKCPEFEDDFYILENGPHFTEKSLEKTKVPIRYPWPEIQPHLDALGITFPECVTQEDIVFTVNSLYETYFPLISDLSGALRFSEKYIKDTRWPKYDRPYQEWSLIEH